MAGSTTIFLNWSMSCELTDSTLPTYRPGGNKSSLSPARPLVTTKSPSSARALEADQVDPEVPLEVGPRSPWP